MTDSQPTTHWHDESIDDALAGVGSTRAGLTQAEAAERRTKYGPNRLPAPKPPSLLQIFAHQFTSPLIFILVIAGVVAAAIGDTTDAMFIGAVLLLNAVIGGLQEWKAEKSSRALQQLLHSHATVVRDGRIVDIDAEELVPGDIVALESGHRVTADLRLISTNSLEIDESLLTGESLAVTKDSGWIGAGGSSPIGDRFNMAYAGSMVVRGRGRGVVVATASATEVGVLAIEVGSSTGGQPPLLIRMARFTRVIGVAVVLASIGAAVIGVTMRGWAVADMFMFGVALAVSAIPEGLPVALTVALAVATGRMASQGVIARRLAAVEGLGSCTYIATDKTGTLTRNELTVRVIAMPDGRRVAVSGPGYVPEGALTSALDGGQGQAAMDEARRLLRTAVVCNEAQLTRVADAWESLGDPTDVALLAAAGKAGLVRAEILGETPEVGAIPFEAENRYAATFVRGADGAVTAHVKGGPERVIGLCRFAQAPEAEAVNRVATELSAEGYRVLAFASGPAVEPSGGAVWEEPAGLEFEGFACMIDPLRDGAADAVAACNSAGIVVSMVTGDHPVTALAIAKELGLAERMDQVVTGADIEALGPDGLRTKIDGTRVYARMSPVQKLDLVNAARAAGHFVAVTGDGVNDAPALRAANIGVAMGKSGTDVAREAADLVITDDDFTTIIAGVEQGRIAYDNVRKVVFLLISTGAGEVLMILGALLLGMPIPLLAAQLLWLNLVTNGIQDVALAFERGEDDVLKRPPRPPNERVFDRLMIQRTLISALTMSVVALGVWWALINVAHMEETSARNLLLLLMVLFENVQVGNSRSETKSILFHSPLKSPILLAGTAAAVLLHISAMYLPFMQRVLGTAPVAWDMWLVLGGLALTLAVTSEVHKLLYRRRLAIRARA